MGSTRTALLDAARAAALAGDWQRTRMQDVALDAGVSRQTLYNEFGSKDALAQALAVRETEVFLDGIDAAVTLADPQRPSEAVLAAVTYTLQTVAGDPLVKAILIDDGGLLPLLTTRGEPVIAVARNRMVSTITERFPALRRAEVHVAAETVTRLVLSYLVLPSDGPDAAPAAVAARIAHLIDRLFTDPSPPAEPEARP
jgi:AcrR family transcriptional regulator